MEPVPTSTPGGVFLPPPYPRPLALALFEHDGRILVFEGRDPTRDLVFYRPLGGEIEFGELSAEALVREIREELGLECEPLGLLGVLENRFVHQGKQGHEIVFVHRARFLDPAVYEGDVPFREPQFTACARWLPLADFLTGGRVLFPEGLTALLAAPARA